MEVSNNFWNIRRFCRIVCCCSRYGQGFLRHKLLMSPNSKLSYPRHLLSQAIHILRSVSKEYYCFSSAGLLNYFSKESSVLEYSCRSYKWLRPWFSLRYSIACDLFRYECHRHHRSFTETACDLCGELAMASYTASCSLRNACFMATVKGSKLMTRRLRR